MSELSYWDDEEAADARDDHSDDAAGFWQRVDRARDFAPMPWWAKAPTERAWREESRAANLARAPFPVREAA